MKFKLYKESDEIEDYVERLEMFFAMISVKSEKPVVCLLTGLDTHPEEFGRARGSQRLYPGEDQGRKP